MGQSWGNETRVETTPETRGISKWVFPTTEILVDTAVGDFYKFLNK